MPSASSTCRSVDSSRGRTSRSIRATVGALATVRDRCWSWVPTSDRGSAFKQRPACIVYPGGYAANIGSISALVKSYDTVVVDKLNHMSIVDGARLSGGSLQVSSVLGAGTTLTRKDGAALNCDFIQVKGGVSLGGAVIEGEVRFPDAEIGSQLRSSACAACEEADVASVPPGIAPFGC